MGEAASKPSSFELSVSADDRHTLFAILSTPLRCPACKSGPVDTSDPVKFLKFGKVWELFKLSQFEDLTRDDLIKKLSTDDTQTITIETDILRYLIEIILTQSNTVNVFSPVISLLNKLINIAVENKIKIKDYEDTNVDNGVSKSITLTKNELNVAATVLLNAQKCDNLFTLGNGTTVPHGAAIDHPKSVNEFKLLTRTISQLELNNVLVGKETISDADETTFEMDLETVKYLSGIIPRRSTHLQLHPSKLISLANKLEELKK